ncbi:D-isomer specific 2-hydroxyacid dehydrogenase [Armillaria novae-zelandiae]|uniref:D-isomer specific 2-hydroxyacid dehydrogenase n=1 Tax=Armillaria novae-zelandiae TaxID=153914 RepID=A0AA39PKU9_9AGAR|nr:D-isomer specific 2-hydroxyacid dehydrogenase [Armillaria novae-zelandiae]
MALPKVLLGAIKWAHEDVKALFDGIADVTELSPGGKYSDTTAIFRSYMPVLRRFDKELIDHLPPSVKWIATSSAGYDSLDVEALKAKGIYLSNTPAAVDDATATTALFLIIAAMRQFSRAERSLRDLKWKPVGISAGSHDLTGKTLAILGLGGIGLRIAELVQAFPMRVIYHNRRKVEGAPEYCEYFEDVEEMLKQADVLSISVPLNASTTGIVGEKWIRTMKRGSVIVNTARGGVIDEDALLRALEDGHLGSVGLDVLLNEPHINPRILEFPNITLLPHMGTDTRDTQWKMEVRALTNIRDYLVHGMGKDLIPEMRT